MAAACGAFVAATFNAWGTNSAFDVRFAPGVIAVIVLLSLSAASLVVGLIVLIGRATLLTALMIGVLSAPAVVAVIWLYRSAEFTARGLVFPGATVSPKIGSYGALGGMCAIVLSGVVSVVVMFSRD